MTEPAGLRWYVIYVRSGFENRVANTLLEHARLQNLDEYFGEVIVPTEEVIEMRSGQKRKSERKFFPGYVLVQMIYDESIWKNMWHMVKHVPHVLNFVGGVSGRPVAISNKEADRILCRIAESDHKPVPKILFESGEVVRVIHGPFSDFKGVVEDVNYEKNRLRVAVSIFGRSTPVELEFSQVEKDQ